jgi:hypothetical protein
MEKWDGVFSTMIKAGYQVALCDEVVNTDP